MMGIGGVLMVLGLVFNHLYFDPTTKEINRGEVLAFVCLMGGSALISIGAVLQVLAWIGFL